MKTLRQAVQRNTILAFIAGALLSAGLEIFITDVAQRYLGLFLVLFSIFVLFVLISLNKMTEAVQSYFRSPPFIGLTAYGEDEVAQAFSKSADFIRNAKNRVIILSGIVPPTQDPVQPRMPTTRPKFLEAIEEVLAERLRDKRTKRFVYKRVLQSHLSPYSETLLKNQVDPQTFEHCRKVFQILSGQEALDKIEFELVIREPTISCPSILAVDDNFVSLAIISERKEVQLGRIVTVASIQSIVTIEDPTGKAVEHYTRIVENLARSGTEIKTVEN